MAANDATLGGWGEDRAELAAVPVEGVGLYANQPEYVDFQKSAFQLIAKAAASPPPKELGPAYFVLGDAALFARVRGEATNVPMLRVDDSIQLFGRLWIVPRNLGQGYAVDTAKLTPSQVFDYIQSYGGGHRPAIAVHPALPTEAMVYSKGAAEPEECEHFDLSVTNVTIESLDKVLDGLYSVIRSPDQSSERPLWHDTNKGCPVQNAEKAVQHEVTRALAGRFGWLMDVRSEQPSSIGRTDVELVQFRGLPLGQNIRHALIELKVLRSTTVNGKGVKPKLMVRHISQGVRQASEYGEAANSNIRMLCCYDMRHTDDGTDAVFKDFKQPAADRKVVLRRFFLYRSSDALREALDNIKVAAGAMALPE